MIEIEKKRDAQKDEIAELTSQKKKLKNKIDVLASIHAKRDVQVRQDRVDYFCDFEKTGDNFKNTGISNRTCRFEL